jgi:tetratricopeptide (TPR) repeat protein
MNNKAFLLTACLIISVTDGCQQAVSKEHQSTKVNDNVYIVRVIEGGEGQVVITSDSGLVVLNSFWSEPTAQEFRQAITEELERDDFYRLVNLVDRLDMFGGNAAYSDIPIIGHQAFRDKYEGREDEVNAEIERLVDMWRWKETAARERLQDHAPGSAEALGEEQWANTCRQRARELEQGFSLVLPTEFYEERKPIPLGEITLHLIWLGKAGYEGMGVVKIPELSLAIIPGFIMHPHHLAPYPQAAYADLDVPRWIEVMEELFVGEDAVDSVRIENSPGLWPRERAITHLHYIRELWDGISLAESEGMSLRQVHRKFSLENECAFVKEMQVYLDNTDEWIREQHHTHIRLFYLQHKNQAAELIRRLGTDSISYALERIRNSLNEGGDLYIEESAFNRIGYDLINLERYNEAAEVLRLNVEAFPESFNAYDSYAEALMKSGDTENAIENYRKSLNLNPDNDNARQMLRHLQSQ